MKRGYVYALIAIAAGLVLAANPVKLFPLDQAIGFVTILGVIYGIIAAFGISSASSRLDSIRTAISSELNSAIAVGILSKQLSDKGSLVKIRSKLIVYVNAILKFKKGLANKNIVYMTLRAFTNTVAAAKVRNRKDAAIFSSLQAEIRILSSSREAQMFLLDDRLSLMDWILNIFLSAILIIMIALMQLQLTYLLSFLLVSSATISILLIMVAVYRIDELPVSDEKLAIDPYAEVIEILRAN